ncbi:MAG: hypothetical protein QXV57_09460 [Thermoproteota archaeon]
MVGRTKMNIGFDISEELYRKLTSIAVFGPRAIKETLREALKWF